MSSGNTDRREMRNWIVGYRTSVTDPQSHRVSISSGSALVMNRENEEDAQRAVISAFWDKRRAKPCEISIQITYVEIVDIDNYYVAWLLFDPRPKGID